MVEAIGFFLPFPSDAVKQLVLWGYRVTIESMGPHPADPYKITIRGRNAADHMKIVKAIENSKKEKTIDLTPSFVKRITPPPHQD